jgi:mannose-6-phosphate isomerase-like protein (cupin superfamily)
MKAVLVAPGEGRFIAIGSTGAGIRVKASEAETGGLCSVWEGRIEPGTVGATPHFHRERDEFFYVLEGEMVLRIGEESHTVGAGAFAFVPRETIHGFHNASSSPARGLVMHHPAGFEHYLEEAQQLASRGGSSKEWAALAARFDIVPVPPTPET